MPQSSSRPRADPAPYRSVGCMTIEAAGPDGAARENPRQIDELRRAETAEADSPTQTRRAAVVYNPIKVRVADLRALI